MHKNQIWLAFLSTIGLIVMWYSLTTSFELFKHYSLDAKTLPTKMDWSVKGCRGKYALSASYQYLIDSKTFRGDKLFDKTLYRTTVAARKALKEKKQKVWEVWYSSRRPEISSIQKNFPFKPCFSTLVLWTLFAYFIQLGYYVGKFKKGASLKS